MSTSDTVNYKDWSAWRPILLTGLGGFVGIVLLSLIANSIAPIWAALIWSFPVTTIAAIVTFTFANRPPERAGALLSGIAITMASMIALLVTWALGISFFFENEADPRKRVWNSFGVAVAVWSLFNIAIVIMYFTVPAFKNMLSVEKETFH